MGLQSCVIGRSIGRGWWPVIGLTFAAFIFNTSEFIPIGLLSGIAGDFSITESKAGLLITVYAWVVAVASLPLMIAASKAEARKLMLSVVGVFMAGQAMSAFSSGYWMLMFSRIIVACSHAIFWSIVTPLAVRIAPPGHDSRALGMIVAGSSIAMIVGLPLGRTVGLYLGWRMTFAVIALLSAAVFALLALILPKVPGTGGFSWSQLPSLFRIAPLRGLYVLTILTVTAHFTGYSYIEPFLASEAGFGASWITMILMLFGLMGIVGSLLFSRYYGSCPSFFMGYAVSGICVFLLLLGAASSNALSTVALCLLWGLAVAFLNLAFQSEVIHVAPSGGVAVAMSIYSGIYNVGIGAGALFGGFVCSHLSVSSVGYAGALIGIAASVYFLANKNLHGSLPRM
ncbi:MAG: sugar transporter [Bacteroidetes bacterium]|uniref:Sugar transporter n=1 Tax=Candidatus Merdivivens pullistercoris TaxID=2840873 RepID=A0A9D9I4L2_9BACT|nr:sugar transporter [Candidatus Merdivivens pullistercoris]